jgi:hypothetical protein
MSIRYHIYHQENGRDVPLNIVDSIDQARELISAAGRPGRYNLYEHPSGGIPGVYVPREWGYMFIGPAGLLWERRDTDRQHDHWRADGWSVYLVGDTTSLWQLCKPNLDKVPCKQGLSPDQIDLVLAWADAEISKFQPAI